jgi:hypothetical protein
MRQRLGHYSGSHPYEPRYPWRFGGERDYEPGDSSFGGFWTAAGTVGGVLYLVKGVANMVNGGIRYATEHSLDSSRTLK